MFGGGCLTHSVFNLSLHAVINTASLYLHILQLIATIIASTILDKMNNTGRMLLQLQRRGAVNARQKLLASTTNISTPGPNDSRRQMSSYVLNGLMGRGGGGGGGGNQWNWPVTKPNTIFNIVPQGHR